MEYLVGENLSFSYGTVQVLRDVNVRIGLGSATVLVGPNGSGKTTLLWVLSGLLTPASGRVALSDGDRLRKIDHKRTRAGMVFQHLGLWDHLTTEKHLHLVLTGKGLNRKQRRRKVEEVLSRMKLSKLRRRFPGELSGGERQRLGIARALVVEPQWLFMDEPLAHLDGEIRAELFHVVREVLDDLRCGVVLVMHDGSEAMRLGDRIVVLLDGRVAQVGTCEDVYRDPVSLSAARVLGPAAKISGQVKDGKLIRGGICVLENIPSQLAGSVRMILRPEDVTFRPDPSGSALVSHSSITAGGHLLDVEVGDLRLSTTHPQPVAPGTRGCLILSSNTWGGVADTNQENPS